MGCGGLICMRCKECLIPTQNYKRDLANERADRAKTEREVIDLIKDMKKKWKAEAAKKTEEYDIKIDVSA